MPASVKLKPTDPVVYKEDPLLYGEMEVRAVRKDKRVVCRIDPDGSSSYDIFEPWELEVVKAAVAA